jgi:hypothetical protein
MVQIESGKPGSHHEPPDDLNTRELPTVIFNHSFWRIHQAQHSPIYFGSSGENRFDAPGYGILYAGSDEYCAFRESIGRLTTFRVVTSSLLRSRRLSQIEIRCPLTLVDLSGAGLTQLDADARLCTGDYNVAQRWSLALHNHPSTPDGLYYRSRYDPSRYCLALYDHVAPKLVVSTTHDLLEVSFRARLASILDTYNYGFLDIG